MLALLLDGRARTATELAVAADVSPSTASAHLQRLTSDGLIRMAAQGRHRYFRLQGPEVAAALEQLSVLGAASPKFKPNTPLSLRAARTCYDHIAGALGVALYDRLCDLGWLSPQQNHEVTPTGLAGFASLDIDAAGLRKASKRRFAFGCIDWSERRPHLGGALGAAVLEQALHRKWVVQELDSRALEVTPAGKRLMAQRFGLQFGQAL